MSDTTKGQGTADKSGLRIPGFAQLQRLGKSLMLPIAVLPATFVVGTDRRIAFAFVDPDPRQRAEPARVAQVLASLVTPA